MRNGLTAGRALKAAPHTLPAARGQPRPCLEYCSYRLETRYQPTVSDSVEGHPNDGVSICRRVIAHYGGLVDEHQHYGMVFFTGGDGGGTSHLGGGEIRFCCAPGITTSSVNEVYESRNGPVSPSRAAFSFAVAVSGA